jgi:hypothetical protein
MFDDSRGFVSRSFLRGLLELDYRVYSASGIDDALKKRLADWDKRPKLSETQAETAFIQTLFVETWGYGHAGRGDEDGDTLRPKFRIAGEGAGGGQGEADLALGWFTSRDATPQALCEFKDITSNLDQPQKRKNNTRSPVEQCLNYIRGARRGLFGNEPVQPRWGIVTDMNEFRLYWWDRAPAQYLRFVIRPQDLFSGNYSLFADNEDARFDRFIFWKVFHRDFLLSEAGPPPLLRLIERQWVKEKQLEGAFYDRYKAVRERLFNVLSINNPSFSGSKTELLRLSQKLLDRFIFAFYCEDMGERMLFPPQFIREYLQTRSIEPYYDANTGEIWDFFKRFFQAMNSGSQFGQTKVPHINGGLFALDAEIDKLSIPNHVFAAAGQGQNEASLESDNNTLLYLSARYNYAARGDAKESLSLYTLGRIFEQSITELEYREGELEGRDSIAKLSKRKRDGVYYTPEWVVDILIEQSMGSWFAAAKAKAGYPTGTDAALPTTAAVAAYIGELRAIKIADPACGSGAFLIAAFRRLLDERRAAQRDLQSVSGKKNTAIDEKLLISEILANNIYGVDLNPSSVEIAKLALWLHSARADAPLSSLDHTIRCGNSLAGEDYWAGKKPSADEREAVRTFEWRSAFPEVWANGSGGFDIIVGNPPYVKLQNMKKAYPEVAAYLCASRGDTTYLSAQTGNFDLYLPFIEQGLRLLSLGGRMAYIAPGLWAVNEYGEGLRKLVRQGRHLERWIDFKSFQVFDEAITYTALQFFTKEPREAVQIAIAPGGQAADVDWTRPELSVPYSAFAEAGEWLIATGAERALIDRLAATCLRLDDPKLTSGITVGIQTSADSIYHLRRIGSGTYYCQHKDKNATVEIEDAIMKPLVSGTEAKRYEEPQTDTYLLFPYERDGTGVMKLLSAPEMRQKLPKAWNYFQAWETELRARENSSFDDDAWYRFGRNQSIDKQDKQKLVIPRLVENLKVSLDDRGLIYLDNVDVGGVLTQAGVEPAYIMGVLNGPIANHVFRNIAKPFRGDYRSANKQFIAPLPVPNATPAQQKDIADRARSLQTRWTSRRDLIHAASDRLAVLPRSSKGRRSLWPDFPLLDAATKDAPRALTQKNERREWAEGHLKELEAGRLSALQAIIDSGAALEANFTKGELVLSASGATVLGKLYFEDRLGALAEAYWRYLLLSQSWRDAASFANELARIPDDPGSQAAKQFLDRVAALSRECAAIVTEERAMNERLYELYNISADERLLVESGRR